MKYFINQITREVFAYDSSDLEVVERINTLENQLLNSLPDEKQAVLDKLDEIDLVFFEMKDSLSKLRPMTEKEIDNHLNPPEEKFVPLAISKAQAKTILIQKGMWQQVMDYLASVTDEQEKALLEVALNDVTEYRRDSPTLNRLAEQLGISSEELDDMFIEASKIIL